MTLTNQEWALAHELLHVLTNIARLAECEKWSDEVIAATLEHPLYLFLNQNKNLFD